MAPNSSSPLSEPRGCVHPVSKVQGNFERVEETASNRLLAHVSLPWDGRSMGDQIPGMLLLAIICVPLFR